MYGNFCSPYEQASPPPPQKKKKKNPEKSTVSMNTHTDGVFPHIANIHRSSGATQNVGDAEAIVDTRVRIIPLEGHSELGRGCSKITRNIRD